MSDVPVSSSSSSVPPSFSCSAADGAAAASAPPAMPGGIVEKPLEDLYTPPIPADLIKAILNGSCVAFIGAGFSAAAKLPSWGDLLLSVIDTAARACLLPESLVAFLTETVGQAVKTGKSEQYDLVSQLMEDKLGAATVERILKSHLQMPKDLPDAMRQRLQWLDAIPFRAILTTNFDAFLLGLTPGHPDRPFYDVLRPAVDNRARLRFSVSPGHHCLCSFIETCVGAIPMPPGDSPRGQPPWNKVFCASRNNAAPPPLTLPTMYVGRPSRPQDGRFGRECRRAERREQRWHWRHDLFPLPPRGPPHHQAPRRPRVGQHARVDTHGLPPPAALHARIH